MDNNNENNNFVVSKINLKQYLHLKYIHYKRFLNVFVQKVTRVNFS